MTNCKANLQEDRPVAGRTTADTLAGDGSCHTLAASARLNKMAAGTRRVL